MREINSNSRSRTSEIFREWKSPLPYLFGGLGLVLGLIIVALIMLACDSYRRKQHRYSSSSVSNEENMNYSINNTTHQPRILVIMPGDEKPSYLATPIS